MDYSVQGSSYTLHNAVPDIVGCLRRTLPDLGRRMNGACLNAANGNGDGENNRKERSHGTKLSLLTARFKFDKRSQLFIRTHNETLFIIAMCVNNEDRSAHRVHP
jgi:hypothetical protein